MNQNLTPAALAQYFDHTLLRANATLEEFDTLCSEAATYGFAMIAINASAVAYCREKLAGSGVRVGAATGFPLGQTTVEDKVYESVNAIKNGAEEIDYVINITQLKAKRYAYLEDEMRRIVAACHEKGVLCKVIFENCYLTDDEKKKMCEIALAVRPDFIKTSTGFGTGGATIDDIKLMLAAVGSEVKVKASGGVRTLDMALELISLGVARIGSSASVTILEDYKKRLAP